MPTINSNRIRLQQKRLAKSMNKNKNRVSGVNKKISLNQKKRIKIKKTTNKTVLVLQKKIRSHFESIRTKINLKKVRGIGTGVDYVYSYSMGKEKKALKLDLKFSFGQLGENAIKIRLSNRRLINKADWAMVVGANKQILFFQINKLERFVKENYGSVSGKLVNRGNYFESMVNLNEFFSRMRIKPINAKMEATSIKKAINKIVIEEKKISAQNNLVPRTIARNK